MWLEPRQRELQEWIRKPSDCVCGEETEEEAAKYMGEILHVHGMPLDISGRDGVGYESVLMQANLCVIWPFSRHPASNGAGASHLLELSHTRREPGHSNTQSNCTAGDGKGYLLPRAVR
jgi:hypothetical protein